MDSAQAWNRFFHEWPKDLPQRGVLMTSFGEQIPFAGFLITEHLLLLERRAPDAVGGRKVILSYDRIDAVKIVDPVKTHVLTASGFKGTLADK